MQTQLVVPTGPLIEAAGQVALGMLRFPQTEPLVSLYSPHRLTAGDRILSFESIAKQSQLSQNEDPDVNDASSKQAATQWLKMHSHGSP